MDQTYLIREERFSAESALAYEGLFALGSGYLHVRGSLEEHLHDAPQDETFVRMPTNVTAESFAARKAQWGTYVPGLFGPHPTLGTEMVNLPWFLEMAPSVEGEPLDMERSDYDGYERTLDMRTATLRRTLRWRTRKGPVVSIRFERFVSACRPQLCVQRLTLSSDCDTTVQLRSGIDADVRTNGFDHLLTTDFRHERDCGLRCTVTTNGGDRIDIISELSGPLGKHRTVREPRQAFVACTVELSANMETRIEKRTAVTTSRDRDLPDPSAVLDQVAGLPYARLHDEHTQMWAHRWEESDVIVEGDTDSQLALRTSLYHLLRAHVPDDSRVAIDAKGYAGDAYFGRFFWDTEMYMLPFYIYTDPARARTLVEFRVQSLEGAKRNAARQGYRGARYAWESDGEGNASCPQWQYGDHEIHVTADVVYALAHYARAVDSSYLYGHAAEAIVETARYWLDRIDYRNTDNHPSLLGVMGPDEYTPLSSNNAYTNRMVSFALDLAAKIGEHGGAETQERARFAEAASGLPIPREEELVMQCEEFNLLAEPRFDVLWKDRSACFAAQVPQERLYRSKCLKQADVLLLMALFPEEFTDSEVRAAWDFYLPYTTHDSSLSMGIHAIVAQRLGLWDEAWRMWSRCSMIDLDVEHNGASQGIHIANCASNWLVAVCGFAGMKTAMQSEKLALRPHLPRQWQRLAFPITWHGVPVYIDIGPDTCSITNQGKSELEVAVADVAAVIPPGATQSFATA